MARGTPYPWHSKIEDDEVEKYKVESSCVKPTWERDVRPHRLQLVYSVNKTLLNVSAEDYQRTLQVMHVVAGTPGRALFEFEAFVYRWPLDIAAGQLLAKDDARVTFV